LGSIIFGTQFPSDPKIHLCLDKPRFDFHYRNISEHFQTLSLNLTKDGVNFGPRGNFWEYSVAFHPFRILHQNDIQLHDSLIPLHSIFGKNRFHAGDCQRRSILGFMLCAPESPTSFLSARFGQLWGRMISSIRQRESEQMGSPFLLSSNITRIPKIIHQLWIGNKSPPPRRIMQTCQDLHPGWEYKFWNDGNLPSENLPITEALKLEKTLNGKADIWRWQLLKMYGGIWIDADTVCLRPLDDIIENEVELFSGYHHFRNPLFRKGINDSFIACSVVGSVPSHPVISAMVQKLEENPKHVLSGPAWRTVGPELLTNFFLPSLYSPENRIGIFPFYSFVPYHYKEGMEDVDPDELPSKVLTYHSFGMNLWGSTFKSYENLGKTEGS